MALSSVEEAQTRELIAQQAALLSLATSEATIISKLGATKKNLSEVSSAVALSDTDLMFVRQGTTDKSSSALTLKNYIAASFPILEQQDYKASVRVASTANVAAISGMLTIDGVTVVAGDRALLKDQSTASQNGIYVAAVGAWSRAADADTGAELNGGAIIPVEEGTVNADTNWQVTNDGVVTIGVTGLTFAQVWTQNFSSNAEAQGFAVTDKSISPATLGQSLKGSNQLLSVNGYQKLPGGLIIQWGSVASQAGAAAIVPPITFPNAVLHASGIIVVISTNYYKNTTLHFVKNESTKSSLKFSVSATTSNIANTEPYVWFAIGY